jgi:hypothetical protein
VPASRRSVPRLMSEQWCCVRMISNSPKVAASWATPVTSGWPRAGWKLGPGPSASLNSGPRAHAALMAVPIRGIERGPRLLPVSVSGWIALGLFGLSILLLLARLVLTSAFGLPFNYLTVFIAMAASGLVAVLAAALHHERSIGVPGPRAR